MLYMKLDLLYLLWDHLWIFRICSGLKTRNGHTPNVRKRPENGPPLRNHRGILSISAGGSKSHSRADCAPSEAQTVATDGMHKTKPSSVRHGKEHTSSEHGCEIPGFLLRWQPTIVIPAAHFIDHYLQHQSRRRTYNPSLSLPCSVVS